MSNNGDIDYDGDSFYFTNGQPRAVADIERDPKVSLSFNGKHGFWAAVEGEAELIRDKAAFEEHWNKDLDAWFKDGPDTEGLVLIKVQARSIKYWTKKDQGDLKLQ